MPEPEWTEVTWDTAENVPQTAFTEALRLLDPPSVLMRSVSEGVAVITSVAALRAVRGIDIRPATLDGALSVALIITPDDATSRIEPGAEALAAANDVIAIAEGVTMAGDYRNLGSMTQNIDPTLPAVFHFLAHQMSASELLTRDAPVGLDEGPDNLRDRANWFRKRH